MKVVYQTFDGTIFDSGQAAKDHEKASKPNPLFVIVDDDFAILKVLAILLDESQNIK